jgi:hypothetical protein
MDTLCSFLWCLIHDHLPWPGEEKKPAPTKEEIKDWFRKYGRERSGAHIGTVHRWIQHTFVNGDTCIWGSSDLLRGPPVTPKLLEDLAQQIREEVIAEFSQYFLRVQRDVEQASQEQPEVTYDQPEPKSWVGNERPIIRLGI